MNSVNPFQWATVNPTAILRLSLDGPDSKSHLTAGDHELVACVLTARTVAQVSQIGPIQKSLLGRIYTKPT